MRRRPAARNPSAFTLIETVIALVVLAIGALGISAALTAVAAQTSATDSDHSAVMLARQMLELVSARPFTVASGDQPGYAQGVLDPTLYDTIGDFDGYTDYRVTDEVGGATALAPVLGTDLAAMGINFSSAQVRGDTGRKAFQRTVSVRRLDAPNGTTSATGPFALVTVNVISNCGGSDVTLSRLFSQVTETR